MDKGKRIAFIRPKAWPLAKCIGEGVLREQLPDHGLDRIDIFCLVRRWPDLILVNSIATTHHTENTSDQAEKNSGWHSGVRCSCSPGQEARAKKSCRGNLCIYVPDAISVRREHTLDTTFCLYRPHASGKPALYHGYPKPVFPKLDRPGEAGLSK